MSATDELRRLLDERGVEWRGGLPNETIITDPIDVLYVQRTDGMIHVYIRSYLTPEQAIAATLGADTGACQTDTDGPDCGHVRNASAKLQAENAKLIVKLNAEHIVRQNVEVENAKLRELVRDLYYETKSPSNHVTQVEIRMSELGIEVGA